MPSQKGLGNFGVFPAECCLLLLCRELSKYHNWKWSTKTRIAIVPCDVRQGVMQGRDSARPLRREALLDVLRGSFFPIERQVRGRVKAWSNPW